LIRLSQMLMLAAKAHARSSTVEAFALAVQRVQYLAGRALIVGDAAAARELNKIGAVRSPARRRPLTFHTVILDLWRGEKEAARAMRDAIAGLLENARAKDWSGSSDTQRQLWESDERGRVMSLAIAFDLLWCRSGFGALDLATFGFGKLQPPESPPPQIRERAVPEEQRIERWRKAIQSLLVKHDDRWSTFSPEDQAYRIVCECLSSADVQAPSDYFDDARVARGRRKRREGKQDRTG
jgi:hypothetical protein